MIKLFRPLVPAVAGLLICILLAGCGKTGIKDAVLARDTLAMQRILKEDPTQANAKDSDGDTILHVAIQTGDDQVVKVLLDHGADVTARNAHGETPLELAALQGSATVMRTLLRGGAKVVSPNALLARAAWAGNVAVAQILLSKGADVNGGAVPGSKDKSSPMHSAVMGEMPDMVEYLIRSGADVNVVNAGGLTPLHLASQSIYPQIARILLEHGAKVNAKTPAGETPLHRAAFHGRTKIIEMLASRGGDLNAKTPDERTPYDVAALARKSETAGALLKLGGKPSERWELTDAVSLADTDAIGRIMAARPEAGKQIANGLTPLHYAARHGLLTSVRALVSHKIDVNIRCQAGQRPLHYAVRFGHVEIVKYLVAQGADVNAKDDRGLTPIGYYYSAGPSFRQPNPVSPTAKRFKDIEEFLLANGAKKE